MKRLLFALLITVTLSACGRGPLVQYSDWSVSEAAAECTTHGQTLAHCTAYYECVEAKTGSLYVGQTVDIDCELQVTPK